MIPPATAAEGPIRLDTPGWFADTEEVSQPREVPMPTRKAQLPAVRITLANGATVVAGRHSLAKLLELTFSGAGKPPSSPLPRALRRKPDRRPRAAVRRPA